MTHDGRDGGFRRERISPSLLSILYAHGVKGAILSKEGDNVSHKGGST